MPSFPLRAALALVVPLLVATPTLVGCAPATSEIAVRDARIALPVTGDSAAAYLTIRNAGDLDDELTSVSTPVADMAHLHRTTISDDGRASMGSVSGLRIPAGSTLRLEPGGLHLMLMDPEALEPGQKVRLTLRFREAGVVTVTATATDDVDVVMGRGAGP